MLRHTPSVVRERAEALTTVVATLDGLFQSINRAVCPGRRECERVRHLLYVCFLSKRLGHRLRAHRDGKVHVRVQDHYSGNNVHLAKHDLAVSALVRFSPLGYPIHISRLRCTGHFYACMPTTLPTNLGHRECDEPLLRERGLFLSPIQIPRYVSDSERCVDSLLCTL